MSNSKDTMRNILLFTFMVNAIPINVITQLPLFIAIRLCKITTWHWRLLAIRFRWAAVLWISEIPHKNKNKYYITLNGYSFFLSLTYKNISYHLSYNLTSKKTNNVSNTSIFNKTKYFCIINFWNEEWMNLNVKCQHFVGFLNHVIILACTTHGIQAKQWQWLQQD